MPETGSITRNGETITYTVRRSARRRKTITIALDATAGVIVSAPLRTSARTIREVVQHRAAWITRQTAEATLRPGPLEFITGETLPYFGRDLPLTVAHTGTARVRVTLGEGGFHITVPAALEGHERCDTVQRALTGWYKKHALAHLEERVGAWAEHMKVAPRQVLVREQRRRWGSCAPDGTLRFNWRLAMADPEIVDYVVVHELLHLRVRNHGPTFWREFTRYMPDCKGRRTRLHAFGKALRL